MSSAIQGKTDLPLPWEPAAPTQPEHQAIKSLFAGTATADQQRIFVEWIAKASGVTELEFRPGDERASAFASGKRFIGLQFFSLAKAYVPDSR